MHARLPSPTEVLILQMLVDEGEKYGLQLVNESEGVLKSGTIYVTLDRMIKKGYLTSRKEADETVPGLPRRLYTPTPLGRKALAMWEMVQLEVNGVTR